MMYNKLLINVNIKKKEKLGNEPIISFIFLSLYKIIFIQNNVCNILIFLIYTNK
jgi:hypothetical protein